jgi:branched-chain amino acid transport system permease protein
VSESAARGTAAIGAGVGGIGGSFFASYLGVVNPAQFEFSFSIFILAMVVLGGLGSISGVVVGAIVLSAANNYILIDLPGKLGLSFDMSEVRPGLYGAILVVVMLLRPRGLLSRSQPTLVSLLAQVRGPVGQERSQ